MMEEKFNQYIKNIEQLAIEVRNDMYCKDYDKTRADFEKIIAWCNIATVIINRIEIEEKRIKKMSGDANNEDLAL